MTQPTIFHSFRDRHGDLCQVREAVPGDGPMMVELLNRVGQEDVYIVDDASNLSADEQSTLIGQRNPEVQCLLVAEVNGRIAGSLEMIRGISSKNRHTATFGMALFAEYRGRALGEGLLTTAHRWAASVGVEKVSLAVFATNTPAIRLYQRLGYKEEGRRLGQYRIQGELVDEVWMALWLNPAPR